MILYMKNFGDVLAYQSDGKACAESIVSTFVRLENSHQPLMLDFFDVKKIETAWCVGFFSELINIVGFSRFKNNIRFSNLNNDHIAVMQDVFNHFVKE